MSKRRASLALSPHACRCGCALAALCVLAFPGAARAEPAIAPPEVLERVDAVPPPEATSLTARITVLLTVLVAADGSVESCDVATTAGAAFDDAALAAVKKWRFRPATRDGTPVPSRIRVSYTFAPPDPPPAAPAASEAPSSAPAAPAPVPVAGPPAPAPAVPAAALDVTVWGQIAPQDHGASDLHITVGALRIVPRANAAEYLKLAPGILLTNEGGEGHAEQVFLRGFDAREGQDVELSADGVPINESGNLHGNGYSDTHFIIPELVDSLRVVEGPFDPRQGNYAVAGSADYHLSLSLRGITAKFTAGSYGSVRE